MNHMINSMEILRMKAGEAVVLTDEELDVLQSQYENVEIRSASLRDHSGPTKTYVCWISNNPSRKPPKFTFCSRPDGGIETMALPGMLQNYPSDIESNVESGRYVTIYLRASNTCQWASKEGAVWPGSQLRDRQIHFTFDMHNNLDVTDIDIYDEEGEPLDLESLDTSAQHELNSMINDFRSQWIDMWERDAIKSTMDDDMEDDMDDDMEDDMDDMEGKSTKIKMKQTDEFDEKGPMSNTEFVNRFMTYGSPLNQMFLIEAVSRYAKTLADASEADLASAQEKNQWISMKAWQECGRQWIRDMEKEYGKR
jgi:hypothetical protein